MAGKPPLCLSASHRSPVMHKRCPAAQLRSPTPTLACLSLFLGPMWTNISQESVSGLRSKAYPARNVCQDFVRQRGEEGLEAGSRVARRADNQIEAPRQCPCFSRRWTRKGSPSIETPCTSKTESVYILRSCRDR